MQSVNTKYINEIIFYLGNIYLNERNIDELSKYLNCIDTHGQLAEHTKKGILNTHTSNIL